MTEPGRRPGDGDAGIAVVGVVGAGAMGAGIAQVALEAGLEVALCDVDEAAIEGGRSRIVDGLRRRARRELGDADAIEARIAEQLLRLHDAHALHEVATDADLVIEAAIEDLDLKRSLFATLDAFAPPDAILATNTSALSVSAIAAATTRPERVVGLHFFNPAPVMPLVEVIAPDAADPAVVERAEAIVAGWGKVPVRSRDVPGFIVNRVNRPFSLEALRMVEAGVAGIRAIDRAIVGDGFPMGPFAYMDLVGIDVNLATTTAVWDGLGRPDRLRPSPIQRELAADGTLGRKTGAGFYRYGPPAPANGSSAPATSAEPAISPEPAERFAATADETSIGAEEIVERIRAAIGVEAGLAADEGVAGPADIDRALRLAANHPSGPFEWLAAREDAGRPLGSANPAAGR